MMTIHLDMNLSWVDHLTFEKGGGGGLFKKHVGSMLVTGKNTMHMITAKKIFMLVR